MKEFVQMLINTTNAQIENYSKAEAEAHLEIYNSLIKATDEAWVVFQGLDSDKSEKRTMQLINNYGSGKMRELLGKFDTMMQGLSMFSKTPQPAVNVEGNEMADILEETAGLYLEYKNNKPALDKQAELVRDRLNQFSVSKQP